MDMQTPGGSNDPSLGELLERLVDESGNLLHAEVRIAEAKITRRMQMAALPIGLLCVSIALALISLMAIATAIVVLLGPLVGFFWAVIIVAVLTGGGACALFVAGRERLQAVFETPELGRLTGDRE